MQDASKIDKYSFAAIGCHEKSASLFLHVGTNQRSSYSRVYDYSSAATAGKPIKEQWSNSPGTTTQSISANIENQAEAGYVLLNHQNKLYRLKTNARKQYDLSKELGQAFPLPSPAKNLAQLRNDRVSVAMPSMNEVAVFWYIDESLAYVASADIRTGALKYSHTLQLDMER